MCRRRCAGRCCWWGWSRRRFSCVQLGGSCRAGWCTGMFVVTVPAMFCWVATTYVEPLLNLALLTAVSFVVRGFTAERRLLWRCALLAGLALGLAAGTKYSALYL